MCGGDVGAMTDCAFSFSLCLRGDSDRADPICGFRAIVDGECEPNLGVKWCDCVWRRGGDEQLFGGIVVYVVCTRSLSLCPFHPLPHSLPLTVVMVSGQIFTMTIPAMCSDDEDVTADLSGTYQFAFTPECRTLDDGTTDPACETFMDTLDGTDGKVVLDVDALFVDDCDATLFEVAFDGEMAFYADAAFTEEVDDESAPFVIGQDTIYGKVAVDIPTDLGFDFIAVEIEAVYVCTAEDAADLSLDSDTGLGGCLSSNIDADGPYKVIGTGSVSDYQGNATHSVAADNEAAFSFLTFGVFPARHCSLSLSLCSGVMLSVGG